MIWGKSEAYGNGTVKHFPYFYQSSSGDSGVAETVYLTLSRGSGGQFMGPLA